MNRRTVALAVALVALVALMVAPTSQAQPDYAREFDAIRSLIDEAVALYRSGDAEAAYQAARDAYLSHYELLEPPLRDLDPDHVFEMEVLFADFRQAIRNGAPLTEVEALAQELHRGLDQDERTLLSSPVEAQSIIFLLSFSLILREGLEAALVVGAVLGYVESVRQARLKRHIYWGTAAALGGSVATFLVISYVVAITAAERELVEVIVSLAAVALLFYVSFWLIQRVEQARWLEFIKAKVWYALSTGSPLVLGGAAFVMVYREGVETVLFYQALLFIAQGMEVQLLLGFVAGAALLAAVVTLIYRSAVRVPLKAFFGFTVAVSAFLSVALIGNAVGELQDLDVVGLTPIPGLPSLNLILSDVTGYSPTVETLTAQGILALVYLLGALYILVLRPLAERSVQAQAPGPRSAMGESGGGETDAGPRGR